MSDSSKAPSRRLLAPERWVAFLSVLASAGAVAVVLVAAGRQTLALLAFIAACVVVGVVGLWLFVAHRGLVRVVGAVLALGSVVTALVVEAIHGIVWMILAALALLVVSVLTGQQALHMHAGARELEVTSAKPARRPFLIMNSRSGGGKVNKFQLAERAQRLGAGVALIGDDGPVDVAELARCAVADGADLLGVAGGDGTQALVAGVAAAAGVPLLVIPAGTRNHFALDLGLDRADPARSLAALTDGVDLVIDLGDVEGRPFVNNVSFGAYATIVARSDYRDDKVGVTLDALPDLLVSNGGPSLTVRANGESTTAPQAALVSNNPYGTGDVAGMGRRARMDSGRLGLVLVQVANARQAVRLLRGRSGDGVRVLSTDEVVVESDSNEVATGIDGESVVLPSPVHCRIRSRALTVRVPRERPGVPSAHASYRLARVIRLAVGRQS
jgi:diacylglycerol kinase family enzyme